MNFTDLRIVFQPDVKTRMQTVDQRGSYGGPIDLPAKQPNSSGKFLWVIGRPPDSLAFARSDRSGWDERRVLCLCFRCLRDLGCFRNLGQQKLI